MYGYFLALGSNLGNKAKNFADALVSLSKLGNVVYKTNFIETEPLKSSFFFFGKQQNYLNGLIAFTSKLNPEMLYGEIVKIEDKIGHNRQGKWLSREIDIDIVRFFVCAVESGQEIWNEEGFEIGNLVVPHVGIFDRHFLQFLELEMRHIFQKESVLRLKLKF